MAGFAAIVLEEASSKVFPSGRALATIWAPIAPLAPGRLSTITGCNDWLASGSPMARQAKSTPPPGGAGQTIRIGLLRNPSAALVCPAIAISGIIATMTKFFTNGVP